MSNPVEQHLLGDSQLTTDDLQQTLGLLLSHDNDFADLYFQSSQHESWVLEDGIIKEGSYNIERGVGVRAVSGEKTGFAYSDEISPLALNQAAKAARGITRQGGHTQVKAFSRNPVTARYGQQIPCKVSPSKKKLACCNRSIPTSANKSPRQRKSLSV